MKNTSKGSGLPVTERLLGTVISCMMLFFMSILVMYSFLQTADLTIGVPDGSALWSSGDRGIENITFNSDIIIINLIAAAAGIMLCFIALPRLKKISYRKKQLALMIWITAAGLLWVHSAQSAPSADSAYVSNAAYLFAKNDYYWLTERTYFYFTYYPFQLGMALFYELVFRVCNLFGGVKTFMVLEYVNVPMLAVSDMLIAAINRRIFRDRRITDLTFLMLAFCAPPLLTNSYAYGIIPGLMFALLAVYSILRYMENNSLIWLLLTFLSSAIAVMVKKNYIIIVTAIVIMLIARMPARKKYFTDIFLAVCSMVLSLFIQYGVSYTYYERAEAMPLDSVPFNTWIYMGLSESQGTPGWFDISCTLELFNEKGFNEGETRNAASEGIKERLRYFAGHPDYTRNFFMKKYLSQWNETSYESIWNTQARPTYNFRRGPVAEWVCGPGEYPMKRYMDKYAQIVFIGVLAGIIASFRRKRVLELLFPLAVLGGILFHLMSETKSQYSLPYFMLMTGYAAAGMCFMYDFARKKLSGRAWTERLFLFGTPAAEPVPELIAAAPAPLPEKKEKKNTAKKPANAGKKTK